MSRSRKILNLLQEGTIDQNPDTRVLIDPCVKINANVISGKYYYIINEINKDCNFKIKNKVYYRKNKSYRGKHFFVGRYLHRTFFVGFILNCFKLLKF
jgi:hypothetical protein